MFAIGTTLKQGEGSLEQAVDDRTTFRGMPFPNAITDNHGHICGSREYGARVAFARERADYQIRPVYMALKAGLPRRVARERGHLPLRALKI